MICCLTNERQAGGLLHSLTAAGFQAWAFTDSGAFFRAISREVPELVILDVGGDALSRLRREPKTAGVPVILLTDGEKAFRSDADACISKPFSMMQLVGRVRGLLNCKQRTVAMGKLLLDNVEHRLSVGHRRARLTGKEYDLLKLFLENPGRLFSREELLRRVWSGQLPVMSRTVDVHIAALRRKMRGCGFCIRTIWGEGYRLEETQEYT